MPQIDIDLQPEEFEQRVIEEAARQMLSRYITDPDGDGVHEVPTPLARRLEQDIEAQIKEQARAAAPQIAEKMLEEGVQRTGVYGTREGDPVPLREIVAQEATKALGHSSGIRSDKSVLEQVVGREVERIVREELTEAMNEATAEVRKAVQEEAATSIAKALEKAITKVKI